MLAIALGPQSGHAWLMKTFGDKLLHGAAFTIGCYCWGRGIEGSPALRKSAPLVAGAIALVVGILIEYLQSYVPSRQSDIYDILADIGGIVPAMVLLTFHRGKRALENADSRRNLVRYSE